jgi:hypothetical protein
MMTSAATFFVATVIGTYGWSQPPGTFDGAGERHSHNPHSIFVDIHADPGGDGTEAAPYQTITEAMERAREIRQDNRHKIIVHVAPGEYVEGFPLYINISNIELRGSTRLIDDEHGMPKNCGTNSVAAPCIETGTETVVTTPTPLPLGEGLFTVSPTKASPTDTLANITISGFVFDAKASGAIGVVRANNFLIEHNVMRRSYPAIGTSWSSGRIRSNFAHTNSVGLTVGGGSETYPARVEMIANRSTNNGVGGAAFGTANFGFFIDPNLLDIQRTYDPAQQPEEVPDKLVIVMIGNDFSRNTMFGFRFEHYEPSDFFYDTTDNQPMTANITATVHGNSCSNNGEYGFLVEGGFATRTNPRTFRAAFTGSFEENDLSDNGRAGLFVGLMLNGFVTRNPDLINQDKYVQDSQFTMNVDEEGNSFGVDYDNPYFDPFDHVTPLNNALMINGDTVIGTHVTCPPGFPCVTEAPHHPQ